MPALGIVGGIAQGSTVTYYRLLVGGFRERFPQANPHILLNSIDLTAFLDLVGIVEAAAVRAKALGFTRLGLLGTRFSSVFMPWQQPDGSNG